MGADLGDVQGTLYDLITAPEGVAKRLDELGRTSADLEVIVKPSPQLSAVARVDVYANMYFYRILDVLRDEYSKTLAVLGDDVFHNLMTDYLVACRPAHPSLREAGARLPAFLADHTLGRERPWIAELARLERAHLELYDGPDADTLAVDGLLTLAPEQMPALLLRAVPCHVILRNGFSIAPVWKAIGAGDSDVVPDPAPETLLVWRREIEVYHRPVDPDEEPLLALIAGGARFDAVCERLLDRVPEDRAPARAFEILGRWVTDGLIARPPESLPEVGSGSNSRRSRRR